MRHNKPISPYCCSYASSITGQIAGDAQQEVEKKPRNQSPDSGACVTHCGLSVLRQVLGSPAHVQLVQLAFGRNAGLSIPSH